MKRKCEATDCKESFYPATKWQKYCDRKCQQNTWKRDQVKISEFVSKIKKRKKK